MKLPKTALNWALNHLCNEGDTDLFPALFEIEAIKKNWPQLIKQLAALDISTYEWQGGRRFVVPKDAFVFRVATQLDPVDSLILAAIIRTFGKTIEKKRVPKNSKCVFSYRFEPTMDGRFYGYSTNWKEFWNASLEKASYTECKWVVVSDITDYYNQIYHHVLQNQLKESGMPPVAVQAIMRLLSKLTQGVSRGIPVGPNMSLPPMFGQL